MLFCNYFPIVYYEKNFFHTGLHTGSVILFIFDLVFVNILYYNTPIYREILLQFLQYTEKYYINRTSLHFRHRAEAVLRPVARLSKALGTACPSLSIKWFYTLSGILLDEKVLARLSTERRLK